MNESFSPTAATSFASQSPPIKLVLGNRYWSKVKKSDDGCWLWTASVNSFGYGRYGIGGHKVYKAHRLSYEEAYGPIPEGKFVCHKCDVPACVRPDHLFLGTAKDNLHDCVAKGRFTHNSSKTHCPQGHEYTEDNIYLWTDKLGMKRRQCLTCKLEGARKSNVKRNERKKAARHLLKALSKQQQMESKP